MNASCMRRKSGEGGEGGGEDRSLGELTQVSEDAAGTTSSFKGQTVNDRQHSPPPTLAKGQWRNFDERGGAVSAATA